MPPLTKTRPGSGGPAALRGLAAEMPAISNEFHGSSGILNGRDGSRAFSNKGLLLEEARRHGKIVTAVLKLVELEWQES
jgi:hypothetical protein